jgi:endonuclease/exonuclease/phosphatase family metal-dependent hydrolase
VGDFNTVAPDEILDVAALPPRLRVLVWMSGGKIRWQVIQTILDAGYVDGFRAKHPGENGLTFPVWNPHVRLDYAFAPKAFASRLSGCDVVTAPPAKDASDHFPLVAELDL